MKILTLDIDTARLRRRGNVEVIKEELPQLKAKKPGRKYRALNGGGASTKLTITQYMEKLFARNELEAIRGKPLTRPQLFYNLQVEFPGHRFNHIKSHRISMGLYQNKYNAGTLHASQPVPSLVSFRYDEQGYIVDSAKASKYLSFEDCRLICAELRIADPRFFSFAELTEIRKYISAGQEPWTLWSVPNNEEVNTIEKRTGKTTFKCLKFPPGLGFQETVDEL